MVTSKLLVRREIETGKVLSQQLLFDDETSEHIVINDLPQIEDREGFVGDYVVNAEGVVEVVYTPIPPTDIEIMQSKLDEQEQLIADLMLMIAGGVK